MANKLDTILGRIAIAGGFITIGTGFFLYNRLQKQYSYAEYVTEPVKILRGYPYAEQILGKPITPMNIKFDGINVQVTELQTKITIPVKGPKAKAMLFSLCQRGTPESEWEVKQLDLQLDPKTPKWTFYKQVGFEETKTDTSVAQTGAESSIDGLTKSDSKSTEEILTKSDSESFKDQSTKSDSKPSKEQLTKTDANKGSKEEASETDKDRTVGSEKQISTEMDDKKKLRWL